MGLAEYSAIALAVLAATVLVLKVVAPKTQSTKDDAVLALLQKILDVLGKGNPPPPSA